MPNQMHPRTPAVFAYLKQCAVQERIVTYEKVGRQVGLAPQGTARPLYFIRDVCLDRGLPPLTALVVRKRTRLPGPGLKPNHTSVTQAEWDEMTSQVFAFDWSLVNLQSDC